MPMHYKAQLTEAEPPMREILDRMSGGIEAKGRPILDALRYYSRRDLQIPTMESPLTNDEKLELDPIIGALVEAAVTNLRMKDRIVVATLGKVAKNPSLFFDEDLPGVVEAELAVDYQRDSEKRGTFSPDICGNERTISGYPFQKPTEANIKKAAEAALARVKSRQFRGRPANYANEIIALQLGKVFRLSGQLIARRLYTQMRGSKVVMVEGGPFYDFLELILPVLNRYLAEQGCAPVTTETVIRLVTEQFSGPSSRLPNFSH